MDNINATLASSLVVKTVNTKNGVKQVVDFKGGYNKQGEWKSNGNWNQLLAQLCIEAGCEVRDLTKKK